MKRHFYKIMMAAAAMLPVFASCTEEPIQPAEPENDSYGVYFETLTSAQKSVEFDPADEPVLTFKAFRTKEDGAITVPISLKATGNDADATSVFEHSALTFEDGQLETEFSVSFPTAELGITYTCNVACSDPEYVKIYSQKPTAFSFEVTRVKWNLVKGPNGEEYGSWKDDIFSSIFNIPAPFCVNDKIKIYERDDKKGYYRIPDVYNPYMLSKIFGGQYPEADFEANCTPGTYSYIDATNKDKVWLPVQSTGAVISNDGYLGFASPCKENGFSDNSVYGTMVNGVIRFPAKGVLLNFNGENSWYYGNRDENLVIVMPGCKDNDFSLSVSTYLTENGVMPVEINMGADLAKTKYKFYEGKVAAADLPFEALAISRDEEADFITESGELSASFEKTGVYTIIAVGVDEKGAMQVYKTTEFSYVAADDEVPVVLSCGIGSAGKYVPQGFSTDNTVEVYVYGEDLVEVKIATVKLADMITNQAGCIQTLLKSKSVDAKTLELINTTGYAGPVTKLLPGTEYVLLVYASNGYEEDLFMSDETVFTTGDPLPIYQSFDHVDEDLLPETKAGYYGSYNLYAISKDNKTGLREYVTTITISDGGVAGEGENTMDLVKIENFWGANAPYLGFDDTTYFEFYGGVLYQLDNFYGQCANNPAWYASLQMFCPQGSFGPGYNYLSYGGYALDGYISFFTNNEDYDFTDYRLFIYSDAGRTAPVGYFDYYQQLLLVDATKDDNGIVPAPKSKKAHTLTKVDYTLLDGSTLMTKERIKREHSIELYTPSFEIVGAPVARPAKASVKVGKASAKTAAKPGEVKLNNGLVAITK